MDDRHWSRQGAVRREDQFTDAPEFLDEHDSHHLPMWGRFAAAWHGMSSGRRVVVASALAVFSLAGGLGIWGALDTWGSEVGTQPQSHGPVAGESDQDGILPSGDQAQDGMDDLQDLPGLLNATSASPSPTPSPGASAGPPSPS